MAEVLLHLWHYLVRVTDFSITLGGTSRIGFFGLLLILPLWSAAQEAKKSVNGGVTWGVAVKKLKPMSIFRKPVVLIWLCLVLGSFGAITYRDHEGLVEAKRKVILEKTAIAAGYQVTINDLRKQLDQARNPRDTGPLWNFESVPGFNGTSTALITARGPMENLAFRVKCNFPCTLNEGGSQAIGTQTGIWLDPHPTNDPTIIRVRVRTPNRLDTGQQLALSFGTTEPTLAPNPPRQISISWVHLDKE